MKLKKIVSLALAGVMAVSMLAGCANNGGNGGNDSGKEPVTQPATGVAAAFNDGQAATNKAEIKFVNDTELDAALAHAVKVAGYDASVDSVWQQIAYKTGVISEDDFLTDSDKPTVEVDKTITQLVVFKLNSSDDSVWNDEAAMKKAASEVNKKIAGLDTTSYKKGTTKEGDLFYDYSYEGTASMVKVNNPTETVDYWFAMVVTQTCDAKTLH